METQTFEIPWAERSDGAGSNSETHKGTEAERLRLATGTVAHRGRNAVWRPYLRLGAQAAALISVGVVLACGSLACHRIAISTSGYRGDGVISTKWFWFNPLVLVDFETFSLADPYEATYKLDGLPYHHSGYEVGIVAVVAGYEQIPSDLKTGPFGDLTLRLRNAEGTLVFECKSSVENLAWIRGERDGERMGLPYHGLEPASAQSRIHANAFDKTSGLPSVLTVLYKPRMDARDLEVHVRLRAGGRE